MTSLSGTVYYSPFTTAPQGVCDLVVGHTDRCLAVYQWCEQSRSLEIVEKFKLSGQVSTTIYVLYTIDLEINGLF